MKFEKEYTAFSYASLAICFAGVSLPYLTSAFEMSRLYHITLFFLAPFFILGGITALNLITANKILVQHKRYALSLVLVVLILFHFFTTGFAYTVAGRGISPALDYDSQPYRFTHHEDVAAARWLYAHGASEEIYIEDNVGGAPFLYADPSKSGRFSVITPDDIEKIEDGDYIHLRYGAISFGKIYCRGCRTGFMELDDTIFIQEGNKIYDCGSAVYQMPYQKEGDTK